MNFMVNNLKSEGIFFFFLFFFFIYLFFKTVCFPFIFLNIISKGSVAMKFNISIKWDTI